MSYFGAGRRDPKQSAREAIIKLREQVQLIDKKEEYLQKKIDDDLKKARANAVSNKAGECFNGAGCMGNCWTKFCSSSCVLYPGNLVSSTLFGISWTAIAVNNGSALKVATAALKRKKMAEQELDRLGGTRLQLEMQVNTLESANLNAETMAAMKKASEALGSIHGKMYVILCCQLDPEKPRLLISGFCRTIDKVDSTMAALNEQQQLANEIAEAISNNPTGAEMDEVGICDIYNDNADAMFLLMKEELKNELDELQQDVLNERLREPDPVPLHLPPSSKVPPSECICPSISVRKTYC